MPRHSLLARAAFCLALALALVVPAHAAEGVSLRWDNCYSDGGVANKTFACDTNTGSERLVMSFELGSDMPVASGIESRLFIVSVNPTLPSWWQFFNAGTCRLRSLSLNTAPPPGNANCLDWGNGNATGGIGSYHIGELGPNSVVMKTAFAVPISSLASLTAGQEYFVGNLLINHASTVGAGACGGCDQPVCIVLDYVKITTLAATNDRRLQDPAFVPGGEFVHWQNGQEANVQIVNCSGIMFGCYHSYTCVLASTPTRSSTWGAVKALYR